MSISLSNSFNVMCQKVYNEVIKEQLRNQGFNHHLSLVNTILHLTFQSKRILYTAKMLSKIHATYFQVPHF